MHKRTKLLGTIIIYPGISTPELQEKVDISESTVRNYIKELNSDECFEEKVIIVDREGQKYNYYPNYGELKIPTDYSISITSQN